jgi:hypothetical protein
MHIYIYVCVIAIKSRKDYNVKIGMGSAQQFAVLNIQSQPYVSSWNSLMGEFLIYIHISKPSLRLFHELTYHWL